MSTKVEIIRMMLQDLNMKEKIDLFEKIKNNYGKIYDFACLSEEERRMWGIHYQGILDELNKGDK